MVFFYLGINATTIYTTEKHVQPAVGTVSTISGATVVGGNVSIIKSDGTTEVIFDDLQQGLTCLQKMNTNGQYYLNAGEDVVCVNVSGVKLLLLETTFMNQKLMNAFTFAYIRGCVRCIHRQLSYIVDLSVALESVGFLLPSTGKFTNNRSLQAAIANNSDRPHIQIVDQKYLSNPTDNYEGSALEEPTNPITYVDAEQTALIQTHYFSMENKYLVFNI